MRPIQEVYSDLGSEPFYGPGNYLPMLESFGYEILLQVDDEDYQGDTRVLFQSGDRIGLLIFGWGSCSGCDALQAASTYAELETLRIETNDSIKWFDTKEAALKYFNEHDWEGDYSWHADETKQFVSKAKELLSPEVA